MLESLIYLLSIVDLDIPERESKSSPYYINFSVPNYFLILHE